MPNVIKTYRYVYDNCNRGNNFTLGDTGNFILDGVPDIVFKNKTKTNDLAKDILGQKNIILMRVIPIYKDTVIGINTCNPLSPGNGCTDLPSQGYKISSTGISGAASRKITVFKGYLQTYLPYLSYGLFVAN